MEVVVVVDNIRRVSLLLRLLMSFLAAHVVDADGAAAEQNEEPAPVDRVVRIVAIALVVAVIPVVVAVTAVVIIAS